MDKLREEFFEKHTETKDGIPKVITHPHNLYEWFKENIQSQQRELLIGYSKLILGDNYEAFEEFELKKIDEYLANL